jgi:hypothetical protein
MSGPTSARWLQGAPEGWAALLAADPSASPSHRPELWAALADALPGHEPHLAVVEEGGRAIGGAPVLVERRGGMHWLHALPMLLPGAPVAVPGAHARVDAEVAALFAALARERRVVGGEWALWRPAGPPVGTAALAELGGETRMLAASVVDLAGGLEAARARIDRKHRQEMRRARERGLAFAEEPGALEAGYALHAAQGRSWRGHRALPLELSRRLLATGGDAPPARFFTLRLRGELVSAALALDGPHETFVWWSGTHPSGRRLNAFPLLLWSIVEWAAAAGRARVNLGASTGLEQVAAFKQSLGAAEVRYPVLWLDARHAPAPARAVAWLQAHLRRGRPRGEAA